MRAGVASGGDRKNLLRSLLRSTSTTSTSTMPVAPLSPCNPLPTPPGACTDVPLQASGPGGDSFPVSLFPFAKAKDLLGEALREFAPPKVMTVSEWADKYLYLSPEYAAEPGKFHPIPLQREPMDAVSDPRTKQVVIRACTQLMKCLAVDTLVPTTDGEKPIRDLILGDKVFSTDGRSYPVMAVSPTYYGRKCYRVLFEGGESFIADEDHIWEVFEWAGKDRSGGKVLRTTGEIYKNHRAPSHNGRTRSRYRVECPSALEHGYVQLPVSPYVLGVWLGDGTSAHASITCDERDGVLDNLRATGVECLVSGRDKCRPHVLRVLFGQTSRIKNRTHCRRGHLLCADNLGDRGCLACQRKAGSISNKRKMEKKHPGTFTKEELQYPPPTNTLESSDTMTAQLRRIGVLNNKHIPDIYFTSSVTQRRSLLQGLLDSDGTATGSSVSFTNTNRILAEDVYCLALSLGLKPSWREGRAVLNGEDCGPSYEVWFTAYREDCVFRLERKLLQLKFVSDPSVRPTESRRRSILLVEPVKSVPVCCISVGSPSSMYLIGNHLIPTHNTTTVQAVVGWVIDVDPGPILVIQPREKDAMSFSKERIAPMLRDTPRLSGKVTDKARASDNTIEEKWFAGGMLAITSAGSPGNLARRATRFLLCDEEDKWPTTAGSEGKPFSLAGKRMATFRHRGRSLRCCSPTRPGSSIDLAYEDSDQREFFVDCPKCGYSQSMMGKFYSNVIWNSALSGREAQASSARYKCESCGDLWDDAKRMHAIERGKWVAQKPFHGIAGFWISELYSPWKTLREIVMDFLVKKDNPVDLMTFVNTSLAENWADKSECPDWQRIKNQAEDYPVGVVPPEALFLTAGVDVQKNRIEAEVVGWGRNCESWSVQYEIIDGDTGQTEVWDRLDKFLSTQFPHALGKTLPISLAFVDSGGLTSDVYRWARTQNQGRVHLIKGDDHTDLLVGQPSPIETTMNGKKVRTGLLLRRVKVSSFKQELYGWMAKTPPTNEELASGVKYPYGFCHFPQGPNYGDSHFQQLCAEQLVQVRHPKTGQIRHVWQLVSPNAANHALDARVYSRAAAWQFGLDRATEAQWKALEAQLRSSPAIQQDAPVSQGVSVPSSPPLPPVSDRRPGGWIDREAWLERMGGR